MNFEKKIIFTDQIDEWREIDEINEKILKKTGRIGLKPKN